jgi:hypothetical protein
MTEPVTSTALIVAVIAIILDKTLPWIAKVKNGGSPEKINGERIVKIENKLDVMSDQLEDLHEWHDKEDVDGVKVWYMRKSLEDAIIKLGENVDRQTRVLESQTHVLEAIARSQDLIITKMQEDKNALLDEIRRND